MSRTFRVPAVMDEHEAFTNFIEGLEMAKAAARQLGYMRANPEGYQSPKQLALASGWFKMAELLDAARSNAISLVTRKIAS